MAWIKGGSLELLLTLVVCGRISKSFRVYLVRMHLGVFQISPLDTHDVVCLLHDEVLFCAYLGVSGSGRSK